MMGSLFAQGSDVTIGSAAAGLVAGTIHHFAVQYPNQARLFVSFYTFALANTIFMILLLKPKDIIQLLGIGEIFKNLMIFDFVYVRTLV